MFLTHRFGKLATRIAALFMIALAIGACGDPTATTVSSSATTAPSGSTGGNLSSKKLFVLFPTIQEAVWGFQRDAITEAAKKDGVQVTFKDAGNNAQTQAADVDNAITQKADAVIFAAVDTSAASALVKKLKDAKIPVIAEDRLPDASQVDIYVTADSYKVGVEQATYLLSKINNKGNVVILEGESGNNVAATITKGYKDTFAKFPDVKIVTDQAHDKWSRDAAQKTMENTISKNGKDGIVGVLANNSGMAMGGVTAAQKAGVDFGKTCIIGADADKDAVESIIAGQLCADVDKQPKSLGTGGYEAAKSLMQGQKPASDSTTKSGTFDVPVKFTPIELIQKTNIADMKYRYPEVKFP